MALGNLVQKPSTQKLQSLSNPWEGRHDLKTTEATIQKMLSGGTPNWVRFPKDYKNFAQEAILAEKEISDKMALRYKMEDQEMLINTVARKVFPQGTRDFIQRLRDFGVICYTIDNGFPRKQWPCGPSNQTQTT